jgi:hypothetical protein
MTAPAHAAAPATRKAPAIESTSIRGSSRTAYPGSSELDGNRVSP